MSDFPHLNFLKKANGRYRTRPFPIDSSNEKTNSLKENRASHSRKLFESINNLANSWSSKIEERKKSALPSLPNEDVVPIFLQIDTDNMKVDSLSGFGIDVVSEEGNGYFIGASSLGFEGLRKKIKLFAKEQGLFKNQAAQLWQINEGYQWRLEQVISSELKAKWHEIQDEHNYYVEVSIACYKKRPDQPRQKKDQSDESYEEKLAEWRERDQLILLEREELELERQDDFEKFVKSYKGEILGSFIDFEDSFGCKIRINGKGLKDIALNYQYVFEVAEQAISPVLYADSFSSGDIGSVELVEPKEGSSSVCIIDSGIQEGHKLLNKAIDASRSRSFTSSQETHDVAGGAGHGTGVAGAVLYGNNIPKSGKYELPCKIYNARVLDWDPVGQGTYIPNNIHTSTLMESIVDFYPDVNIFNMSINSSVSCKTSHMSQWAATLDKLSHEKGKLFIVSAGNLKISSTSNSFPGIKNYLDGGFEYPEFLLEKASRISNPAQSSFALTVGSVCHNEYMDGFKKSFGKTGDPSSFSRTGLGLWGMIKPDVVEFGGDFVVESNSTKNISTHSNTSPEIVQSTLNGFSGVGSGYVGTSYSAPKVAHIAAKLENVFPAKSLNFYRALIVQSARLPGGRLKDPETDDLRHMGYGIPNLSRATENTKNRITYTYSGYLSGKESDIFSIKIPEEILSEADEYDVMIEATLSFTARTRRTRKYLNSYMSTSLIWESSGENEKIEDFTKRVLDLEAPDLLDQGSALRWTIRERSNWSTINGVKRQDNSLQKSWCIMKSFNLPEEICFAVKGKKGWEKDDEKIPYTFVVSFESLNVDINLYEMIQVENEIPIEIQNQDS